MEQEREVHERELYQIKGRGKEIRHTCSHIAWGVQWGLWKKR